MTMRQTSTHMNGRALVWFFVAFVTIFATLGLYSCRRTPVGQAKIRVGYLPYSSSLSFLFAQEKGYFVNAGLAVEAVECGTANEALDGLRAGHLDFVAGLGLSTFFAMEGASAGSFKCFQPCVEDASHGASFLLIPKGSGLTGVKELKGKKVGTYSGTSQVLVLRLLLRKLGFDPDDPADVQIGDVASNLQVDALANGNFDAFLMLEPYATKAMVIHGARALVENPRVKYILDPFPAGANAVSSKFLKEHPDLAEKAVAVLDQAIEDIHRDEVAAKAILPKYDKTLTAELAVKSGIYRWWKRSETSVPAIQEYADLLYEGKALKNKVNVDAMFLK
jgi:ABC-type nitrate/sulfonate/bicarbonate transport system substrate-binding protein